MNLEICSALLLDGYKVDHRRQYPSNSKLVFSNLTARGTRVEGLKKITWFGLQYFMQEYLIDHWNRNFFSRPVDEVAKEFTDEMLEYLGPNEIGEQHIRDLHAVGYLPITVWSLPEGSAVNLRVPTLVMWNTDERFYWLTNALETILSTTIWMPTTSATTAVLYRQQMEKWCKQTNPEFNWFTAWQGHDFSFRGHGSYESACTSGGGHLLAFDGTDTVPARRFLKKYYGAAVGGSVSATEHSVMCMGGKEGEDETFRRLIEDLYPNGIVSIVSDTWNLWEVVNPKTGILVRLKDKIMARDGKVVIRPDSGDPVKIMTGYKESEVIRRDGKIFALGEQGAHGRSQTEITELEFKGVVQCLYEIFGGTKTSTGYIQLDSHIGAIYGDSITLERNEQMSQRLADNGFASTNVVFGLGSFTYQGAITPNAIVTRDTHCFAVKSTYGEVEEDGVRVGIEIFKDPITDSGMKKSAKGLLAVYEKDGEFVLKDQATWEEVMNCAFNQTFLDGKIVRHEQLADIRALVAKNWQ